MKITVAMDSFKGSMTSLEAGNAVKNGILKYWDLGKSKPDIIAIPVADGGEGTLEALTYGRQVTRHTLTVTGPLGEPVSASYVIADGDTAIIEMAEAAGLTLVPKEKRNPLHTTTYGVGELIMDALNRGCSHFIVGIGGSATNDCGMGMLQALGFDILDNASKNVSYGANGLKDARFVSAKNLPKKLLDCDFMVACDVDNPLVGEKGCSRIFAPQKGATPDMVEQMDGWMNSFADVVEAFYDESTSSSGKLMDEENTLERYDRFTPGAGAAGGLGYAFLMFLGAKLLPGAQIVIRQTGLEEHIKASDVVIVGEGRLDAQSTMGKIPFAIASLAKKYGKKVIAIAGLVEDESVVKTSGVFDEVYTIDRGDMSLDDAMKTENAISNLSKTVESILG